MPSAEPDHEIYRSIEANLLFMLTRRLLGTMILAGPDYNPYSHKPRGSRDADDSANFEALHCNLWISEPLTSGDPRDGGAGTGAHSVF